MTKAIFQTDAYRWDFDAVVTASENNEIVLDVSAFYPGGGGQPHDLGTITADSQTWNLTKITRRDGEVRHQLDAAAPAPGTTVNGQVDRDRRYALMRTHTAMHILCGVVFRDHGAMVTGSNMEPLRGRMDFEFESMRQELVLEIEEAINLEVCKALPIEVAILPREQAFAIPDLIRTKINLLPPAISEVRTVEIVGLDLQADSGTHVANTAEVGTIRISGYKSKGRINKRLEITLDQVTAP